MSTDRWNIISVALVKNVFHSSALIEIMHNACEIIEDNGEKLHELWFANNCVTKAEHVLHKIPLLKVTLKKLYRNAQDLRNKNSIKDAIFDIFLS